jgi:hypothetical protein
VAVLAAPVPTRRTTYPSGPSQPTVSTDCTLARNCCRNAMAAASSGLRAPRPTRRRPCGPRSRAAITRRKASPFTSGGYKGYWTGAGWAGAKQSRLAASIRSEMYLCDTRCPSCALACGATAPTRRHGHANPMCGAGAG